MTAPALIAHDLTRTTFPDEPTSDEPASSTRAASTSTIKREERERSSSTAITGRTAGRQAARLLYYTVRRTATRKIWLCTAVSRACCRPQSSLPSPELAGASRAHCRVQSSLPLPELTAASKASCRLQSVLLPPELATAARVYYRYLPHEPKPYGQPARHPRSAAIAKIVNRTLT